MLERLDYSQSNFLAGGRAFWRNGFDSEVGVSFLQAVDAGVIARRDLAVDAWWRASAQLSLGGNGQWSLLASRLAEGRLFATWQPVRLLQFTGEVLRTAPDLFISRTSIFSVFAEDRRTQFGGEIALRFGPALSAYLQGHFLQVEPGSGLSAAGNGYDASGKITWHPIPQAPTTVGAEVRLLDEPDNGFQQLRLFIIHRFPHEIRTTLELDGYRLEHSVNGRMTSLIALATCGYSFAAGWDAMLAASLGTTPYLDRRAEVTARLTYRFGIPGGRP